MTFSNILKINSSTIRQNKLATVFLLTVFYDGDSFIICGRHFFGDNIKVANKARPFEVIIFRRHTVRAIEFVSEKDSRQ